MNSLVRRDVNIDRDLIFVTEPIWRYFIARYKCNEEIKRYAIERGPSGQLDRSPHLPVCMFTIVIRDEEIRAPKLIVLPRKSKFGHLKHALKEAYSWLRDYPSAEMRLWRLDPSQQDQDFLDQYNHSFRSG